MGAALGLAVALGGAGVARANTLTFTDTLTSASESVSNPGVAIPPSTCGTTPAVTTFGGTTSRYRAYAFRSSPSGASDCITISYGALAPCPPGLTVGSQAYAESFDPLNPATNLVGGSNVFACGGTPSYSFSVPAGQTFLPIALEFPGGPPGATYNLSVTGTNVVEAQEDQASGTIAGPNTFSLHASSLPDGTSPEGTVTVTGAHAAYTGAVRCLRTSGNDASLVMTFDGTQTGEPASIKGAVWWIQDTGDGAGAQCNSLLTQHALDTRFATCPDPTTPPTGTFNPLTSGRVSVVTDPPLLTPPGV